MDDGMQIGSDFGWHIYFLGQFNISPYQPPQHPWYWSFRWVGLIIVARAVFWLVKQLPKENKSLRKPVQKSPNTPYSTGPAALIASEPAPAREILVLKDGQQIGPYPLEEINRQISANAFAPSDLAWHEGLAEWQPLSSIAGVIGSYVHHLHPPPPPVRTGGWPSSSASNSSAPSSVGLLVGGYACAAVSLMFLPPFLGLAGIICGVVIITRKEVNKGATLLVVSFLCAVVGMIIGAAS